MATSATMIMPTPQSPPPPAPARTACPSRAHCAWRSVIPPSTEIHWPVMFRAESLARNAARIGDVLQGLLAAQGHRSLDDLEKDPARVQVRELGHPSLQPSGQALPRTAPHEARADRVHADVVRGVIKREALRERDHSGLRGGLGRHSWRSHEA